MKNARQLWTEKLTNMHNRTTTKQRIVPSIRGIRGIILGLDPSLRGTGLAIIDNTKNDIKLLMSQRISCPSKMSFFECIEKIFTTIDDIVTTYHIDSAAIEQTIYVQNVKTSHILGAAKGAAIAAIAKQHITISEYAPLRIKQAITGIGRASKEQVQRTVCSILKCPSSVSFDESDAMAVACCHAWTGH